MHLVSRCERPGIAVSPFVTLQGAYRGSVCVESCRTDMLNSSGRVREILTDTKDILQKIRDEGINRGASFVEVRLNERESTSIALQDGQADKLFQSSSTGLGVRVLVEGSWGFASANGLDLTQGLSVLDEAVAGARATRAGRAHEACVAEVAAVQDSRRTPFEIDPRSVPLSRKMDKLQALDSAGLAKGQGKLVNRVVSYGDGYQRETVCNSFGSFIESEYVRTSATATLFAQDGDVRQRGYTRKAALAGYELLDTLEPADFSEEAAEKAVDLLSARKAPSGKFPVIFHPSITGLLTHEALGHNAEADHIVTGTSILEGRQGDQVASPLITIVDDATLPGLWGSYFYDSEGTQAQRRVLIEDGRLVGFMHNLETAAKMGVAPNGSGRAQDYHYRPLVRMSNTFILPGETKLADMLKDIDLGVYLTGGHWGYVFCERGQFTCHAGGGWIIRNGELAEPIRDVSVAGLTLETLANVDAISDEFEMTMPGMCGKCGQGMPVNAGGPHVRVKELVVGGQQSV